MDSSRPPQQVELGRTLEATRSAGLRWDRDSRLDGGDHAADHADEDKDVVATITIFGEISRVDVGGIGVGGEGAEGDAADYLPTV